MATPTSWILAVKGRILDRTLRELTNPDSETQNSGGTVDDDVLDNAIDDAIGEFSVKAGFDPQLTDKSHVGAIVVGVVAYLRSYKDSADEATDMAMLRFVAKCKQIRDIATSSPGTTADTTPTDRTVGSNGRPIRPDADRSNYSRYLPTNRFRRDSIYGDNR